MSIFSGLGFFNEPEISDSGTPAYSPSRRTCAQDFYVLIPRTLDLEARPTLCVILLKNITVININQSLPFQLKVLLIISCHNQHVVYLYSLHFNITII